MAVLNTRCAGEGLRRSPNRVQAPTRAAPTGPTRTAAARVAEELGDQAISFGRSSVAVDSKITSERTQHDDFTPPGTVAERPAGNEHHGSDARPRRCKSARPMRA